MRALMGCRTSCLEIEATAIEPTIDTLAGILRESGIKADSQLDKALISSFAVMDQYFTVRKSNNEWFCGCYMLELLFC